MPRSLLRGSSFSEKKPFQKVGTDSWKLLNPGLLITLNPRAENFFCCQLPPSLKTEVLGPVPASDPTIFRQQGAAKHQ
jgi:hypothetical protein